MNPTQFGRQPVKLDSIRSAYAGSVVYPPGGTHGPRRQADVQIVLLHSGSLRLRLDDDFVDIAPGTMVLLRPGHREHFAFSAAEDSWHSWVTVTTEPLPPETVDRLERLPFALPIAEALNRIVDVMIACRDGNAPDCPLMRALGLSALELYAAESAHHARMRGVHRAVMLCKQAVRERFGEPLRLADLAAAANVSPEHLVRLFRQYEGMTPISHLWRFRIERCEQMLRDTGLGVHEIALRAGFKNGHHFSRMFRRITGMTPTEFRSRAASGNVDTTPAPAPPSEFLH